MSSSPHAERLNAHLRRHGAGDQSATGQAAWNAFKDFGREMHGASNIGLLFQVGTHNFTGTPLFYFDPVCQFEISDPDGEHDHFEQLHCELTRVSDDQVNGIEASLWSFGYPTADAFFEAVEALPAFQVAVNRVDYALSVSHEVV